MHRVRPLEGRTRASRDRRAPGCGDRPHLTPRRGAGSLGPSPHELNARDAQANFSRERGLCLTRAGRPTCRARRWSSSRRRWRVRCTSGERMMFSRAEPPSRSPTGRAARPGPARAAARCRPTPRAPERCSASGSRGVREVFAPSAEAPALGCRTQPSRGRDEPYRRRARLGPVRLVRMGRRRVARARAHDKPIPLAVGYSARHRCHVTADESFQHPRRRP